MIGGAVILSLLSVRSGVALSMVALYLSLLFLFGGAALSWKSEIGLAIVLGTIPGAGYIAANLLSKVLIDTNRRVPESIITLGGVLGASLALSLFSNVHSLRLISTMFQSNEVNLLKGTLFTVSQMFLCGGTVAIVMGIVVGGVELAVQWCCRSSNMTVTLPYKGIRLVVGCVTFGLFGNLILELFRHNLSLSRLFGVFLGGTP